MLRYDRKMIALAALLSMLAGYVDALGFISLGGLFVSFMSGNTTRLAVSLAEGAWGQAALAGGIVAAFVAGVVAGSILARLSRRRKRDVLALVALVLATTAILHTLGAGLWILPLIAFAMGAENTVFERDGEVSIALTYMTGTLVRLGQRLAAALSGGPRWAWARYFFLWLGLLSGAAAGALSYHAIGLHSLWAAALAAAALSWVAGKWTPPRED